MIDLSEDEMIEAMLKAGGQTHPHDDIVAKILELNKTVPDNDARLLALDAAFPGLGGGAYLAAMRDVKAQRRMATLEELDPSHMPRA